MITLAAFALAACLAVDPGHDRILAGDLATVLPEWSAVPADTPLGLAPAPGVQRVLRAPELRRLAERWNVSSASERETCITRPAAVIPPERLLEAMRKELPGAQIEILESSRMPAPEGNLIFPLAGLRQTPFGGYWNGYVVYAGKQRFTLWARVKVRVNVPRVTAAQPLSPGVPVDAAQLRVENREDLPAPGFAAAVHEIAGRGPRRPIAAGTSVRPEWFDAAKAVVRGEPVQVEVTLGGTRLKLEGIAEGTGVVGDTIQVQNPTSHQRFPARILARGKVVVAKGTP